MYALAWQHGFLSESFSVQPGYRDRLATRKINDQAWRSAAVESHDIADAQRRLSFIMEALARDMHLESPLNDAGRS
jgi:hypothetical protein